MSLQAHSLFEHHLHILEERGVNSTDTNTGFFFLKARKTQVGSKMSTAERSGVIQDFSCFVLEEHYLDSADANSVKKKQLRLSLINQDFEF